MGKVSNLVPEGWSVKGIADLVTLQYGKSPREIFNENGPYPVIGTGGVTGATSSYLHEGGTTVIGRKGTINKPSYIKGRFWAIDTTYYGENYQDVDPKWFYYNISSFDLMRYNEASGVPSLNRDTLYAIQLLKPPLPEQQKIATILSSVDDVIEKTRAQIDKLKDLKTGMMQELLTQGIGHTEFKNTPIGRIPKAWEIQNINGLVTKVGSGVTPRGGSAAYVNSGIPLIRSQNVYSDGLRLEDVAYITAEQHKKMANSQLKPNDVLLNITGASIGRCHYLPSDFKEGNVNQHVCIIRPKQSVINSAFLAYLLNSELGQRQIMSLQAGGNREGLNFQQIREISFATPTLPEQQKIVNVLQSIDTKIMTASQKLNSVEQTKKALMQDLLTGKVRVVLD